MRAAVIPTMGRDDLKDCMAAIGPQVDYIILVTHHHHVEPGGQVYVVPYNEDPPNISKMWNIGLDLASYLDCEYVAVLNDDAIVPENWFIKIEAAMYVSSSLAGWASGQHDGHLKYTKAEPTLIRMTGYAFVVHHSMRADEQFQWWYGDNDLEWTARVSGGVVHVGGEVEHRYPNSTTVGELARIAREDRKRFQKKWGRLP